MIWLQTGFIGDVVLTTAACELLSQELPHIRQFAITTQAGDGVLEGCPHLERRFVFNKRSGILNFKPFLEMKRALQHHGLSAQNSVILQGHRSTRSSLLAFYLGLPTVTYDETPLRFHASWKVPRVAVYHETGRIGMLLQPFGIPRTKIIAARPSLSPLEIGDHTPLQFLKAPRNFIGIAPGSVWGTKRWPRESFSSLVDKLLKECTEVDIVLLGSIQEEEIAKGIFESNSSAQNRIHNLVGKTSLKDLRRIFPRLKLLIANDSSPIHYASAFSVATVALFGATIPAMGFGPTAPGSRALGIDLSCRPCSDHGPQICPLGHFQCMKSLTVDSVFKTCKDVFQKVLV